MSQPKPATPIDFDFYEAVILSNALVDQEYLAAIHEHVEPKFFLDGKIGRTMGVIVEFFKERGTAPSVAELRSRLVTDVDRKAFEGAAARIKQAASSKPNKDELYKNTERFLRERSVFNTISDVAEKLSDNAFDPGDVLAKFEKAYNITLNEDLGHWYLRDIDKHIRELTTVYNPIPTGWSFFDNKTEGGLYPKTLVVFAGQVNVGKSIVLGNVAANLLLAGKNVLLVSLEMSEYMYARRISAQLSQIPHNDLKNYTEELRSKITNLKNNLGSQLVIKEYSPKTITVRHIDGLIAKLHHKGFHPDVLVVDYVNLIQPLQKGLNSYESVKEVAEHLRGLAFKHNINCTTATQINRSGFNVESPGMENVAECIEVNQTVTLRDGSVKKIGEIQFGDQITANDGYKTVTQVHHKNIKQCYRITLKSGKQIIVSDKHKFPTNRGRISIVDGLRKGDRLSSVVCQNEYGLSALARRILNYFFGAGAKSNIT